MEQTSNEPRHLYPALRYASFHSMDASDNVRCAGQRSIEGTPGGRLDVHNGYSVTVLTATPVLTAANQPYESVRRRIEALLADLP